MKLRRLQGEITTKAGRESNMSRSSNRSKKINLSKSNSAKPRKTNGRTYWTKDIAKRLCV